MKVDHSEILVKTNKGSETRLKIADKLTVFRLAKASFTDVDFGTYVGSVSVQLDDYSPIVRDSLSWLHRAFELRIFDEQLRGLALGHMEWDLTPESVMTHGWVDDLEVRVISIKFGPTEEEETDVDIPRDVPISKISLGDKGLIKQGANIFAGAVKDSEGNYMATFVFVGEDGAVPAL
ncbi:MAG: hypothetical protein JSW20_05900 [Nitrospiraceae bacterium]|nr:MAG: hypothetical protein JSW20_05900 [Nitrospiraceae bacterium]